MFFRISFARYTAAPPCAAIQWMGIVLLAFCLVAPTLNAQESKPWLRGIEVGASYATGDATINFDNEIAGAFHRGVSIQRGLHLGASLPSLFSPLSGTTVRGSYVSSSAQFITQFGDVYVLLPGSSIPVNQIVEAEFAMRMESMRLDLRGEWELPWDFTLSFGPAIGYRTITFQELTQHLREPIGARFINPNGLPEREDGRVLVYLGSVPTNQQRLSLGAAFGVSRPITLVDGLSIRPEIGLRGDFLSPVTDTQWRTLEIEAAMSLAYSFGTRNNDTRFSEAIAPEGFLLHATIDLYGIDAAGRRTDQGMIRVRKSLQASHIDLPQFIRFEPDSSAIPESYAQLTPEEFGRFTLDSIAQMEPAAIYPHLLNIIGARMREDPAARLRLIGTSAAGTTEQIALRRAESIRDYLVDRLGCDPRNVRTSAAAGDSLRTNEVRIEAASTKLLRPLMGTWRSQRFESPRILVEPIITADTGISEWSLVFRQNDREIARQNSRSADTGRFNLDMVIRNLGANGLPAPLSAEFSVADSAGNRITARDEIAFGATLPTDSVPPEQGNLVWVLLDTTTEKSRIEEIARSVTTSGRVTVAPLSRRAQGPTEEETRAARRIAGELRSRLRVDIDVDIDVASERREDTFDKSTARSVPLPGLESAIVVTVARAESTPQDTN